MRAIFKGVGFVAKMVIGTVTVIIVLVVIAGALISAGTKQVKKAAATSRETHVSKTFASGKASGEYAIAQAGGTTHFPRSVYVVVHTSTPQEVHVSWTLVCSEGSGISAGSKSGQFSATTPVRRRLELPSRENDSCVGSANSQLTSSGDVTISLVG